MSPQGLQRLRRREALGAIATRMTSARSWRAVLHLALGLLLAPLYWLPPLGALLGLVTLPLLLLGLPLLLAAMRGAATATAAMDRRLARQLGIARGPDETPRPPGASLARRLTGRWGWRQLGDCLVGAAWATGTGALMACAFVAGGTLLALPVTAPLAGIEVALMPLESPLVPFLTGPPFQDVPDNPLIWFGGSLLGLTLLVGAVTGAWPLVRLEAALTLRMREPAETRWLRQRIASLETTRTQLVDAAEAERRRIERDLHDGAQQRLLAVTIAISRANRQLARDPQKAQALLDEAHGDARAAIEELRGIARSSHPPVLSEQGLPAAVTTMAHRCPVPVSLELGFEDRPSRRAEAVAYYVLSELLANIAKHAAASKVSVRLWREDDRLRLRVTDDGQGGAVETEGGGLAGLRARLDALDGTFAIASPPGGATVGEATLPWNA